MKCSECNLNSNCPGFAYCPHYTGPVTTKGELPDWNHLWIREIIQDLFIPYVAVRSKYTNYKSLSKNGECVSGTIEND